MDFNEKNVISPLLAACLKGERKAQRELYTLLYPYGMSICLRYTKDEDEAKDVLNVSFLKIFKKLSQHAPDRSFKAWVRRIFVNTSIDHYRKNSQRQNHLDLSSVEQTGISPDVISSIGVEKIMQLVTKLPPSYRMVFNLYAVEGYTHREIGEKLGINEGTSKSNLNKARTKLKAMIAAEDGYGMKNYG